MPLPLNFRTVQLDDRKLFKEIRQCCDLYCTSPASETTFESVFCWAAGDFAQVCIIDEGIIIFYEYASGLKAFYPPLVRSKEDFVPVLQRIREHCIFSGFDLYIERMTKEMAELAEGFAAANGYKIFEERNAFEYLYNAADFIGLKGGNYKSKRNLVHGFTADYDFEFLPYEPSLKKGILDLVTYLGNPIAMPYQMEFAAIERALDCADALNLHCDVIKAEGEIVAFHICFINEANVGTCLFEKSNTGFRGSYTAITHFSSEKRFSNCTLINRQEDLGIEGLRTSKMSYLPVGFSEKYIIKKEPELN